MLTDYKGRKCPDSVIDLLIEKLETMKKYLSSVNNPKLLKNSSLLFVFDRGQFQDMNDAYKPQYRR